MKNKIPLSLGILQAFVALMAIPAGLSMISQADGSGIGIQLELLDGTPFRNYLIPGLFLFVIHGLLNVVACLLSFSRKRMAGIWGLSLGLILLAWILIQVYFIGFVHFLQPMFFVVAIIEITLSYFLIRRWEPPI